jgi:hypothetical protein
MRNASSRGESRGGPNSFAPVRGAPPPSYPARRASRAGASAHLSAVRPLCAPPRMSSRVLVSARCAIADERRRRTAEVERPDKSLDHVLHLLQLNLSHYRCHDDTFNEALVPCSAAQHVSTLFQHRTMGATQVCIDLGCTYSGLDDHHKSIEFLERAAKLAQKVQDSALEQRALMNLACAHSRVRCNARSTRCFNAAPHVATQVGGHDKAVELHDCRCQRIPV